MTAVVQYLYFVCLVCMWLVEVTDTDFHPYITAWVWGWGQKTNRAPSHCPAPVYECGHLWLDGGSLLWNPSPHVVSMWKKWGTVRLLQRERDTHAGGLLHTLTSAGIFLPLAPYCDEQWLLMVFFCLFFARFLFFQHWIKEYLAVISGCYWRAR